MLYFVIPSFCHSFFLLFLLFVIPSLVTYPTLSFPDALTGNPFFNLYGFPLETMRE